MHEQDDIEDDPDFKVYRGEDGRKPWNRLAALEEQFKEEDDNKEKLRRQKKKMAIKAALKAARQK